MNMRKSLLAKASLALMLMASTSASAGLFRPYPAMNQGGRQSVSSMQLFPGSILPKAVDANGNITPDNVLTATHTNDMNPVGILTSPTGKDWFYTLETDGDKITENEYYTEWNYKTFKLTVYDGELNPDGSMHVVGYAHGEAHFPEGAKRCNSIWPDMQLTSKFFNSNTSDFEVCMVMNFNPGAPYYGAKQRSQVYSLKPEMSETPQEPVFETDGMLSGVINGSTDGSEGFVISFTEATTWTNEMDEHKKITLKVYKAASWGKGPELIAKQTSLETPGSGDNDPNPFFICVHGSDVYSVRTYYEYPWLEDSEDPEETPVMRPDNNFIIELYKPTAKNPIFSDLTDPDAEQPTPWKTVKIPCSNPDDPEKYEWRSYALGNFSGDTDVTWDFSDGEDPCFIITIVDSNHLDESIGTYEVWNCNGERIKTFGKDSAGYTRFPSCKGQPEQYGFNVLNDEGTSVTQIINWPSLEVAGELPTLFEYNGNIFTMTTVPSRVMTNQGILYGANALPASEAANSEGSGYSWGYIAYFTADGELHHMDELKLPENTAKAYAYIDPIVLDPYLFNTDETQEYIMWMYSWKGNGQVGTNLALAVVDNTGRILAKYGLPDGNTDPYAYVTNTTNTPLVAVTWYNPKEKPTFNRIDIIRLPLNNFEGEGTVENPYLIRTFGDLDQMRNNLTSHFALDANIDCKSRAFRPIEGTFLGSLDGRGHAIKDLYLTLGNNGAMFSEIGQRPEEATEEPTAFIKNIVFDGITVNRSSGTALGTKQFAMIAQTARYAEFNKVHVVNPKFELAGINAQFGVIANKVDNSKFIECAVKDADINIERATTLAGIAANIDNVEITNAFVSGKFAGRSNVGAIAGQSQSTPSSITNCHVNADITATNNTAGGVIAQNASRSILKNNIVEGTITASSNAGGICGYLESYANAGTDEPEIGNIVEGNVVALTDFTAGTDTDTELDCVHRVVGYSSADAGTQWKWIDNPDWDPEDPNSDPGNYEQIPAAPDDKIGTNYVLDDLEAFDKTEGLLTEGTSIAYDELDEECLTGIGFKFGNSTAEPWVKAFWGMPKLYFEDATGFYMQFLADSYEGTMNETLKVYLEVNGADVMDVFGPGLANIGTTDPNIAEFFNPSLVEGSENQVCLELNLKNGGETELFVEYKGVRATTKIKVLWASGIESAVAENGMLTYADGIVTAEGCAIAVYDVQGREVATGYNKLATSELATGLYIVRATAAGNTETMKIMVK